MASQSGNWRPWSDLPTEMLQLIASFLPLSDHPYFACVCKNWREVILPVYPAESPLLAYYQAWGSRNLRYYCPLIKKTFIVDSSLDLSGALFYSAKDGWLLFTRPPHQILLVNPMTDTMAVVRLMDDFAFDCFSGVAISGQPPYDCTIFAIYSLSPIHVDVYIIRGHQRIFRIYDDKPHFIMAEYSNPVFHRGVFYCLGSEGNLGIFDPEEYTWVVTVVLPKPKFFGVPYEVSFLVESAGELLSVLISKDQTQANVFKLNQEGMAWEKFQNLGSLTLFAGLPLSLATTLSPARRTQNRVYIPRIYGTPEAIQAEVKFSEGRIFLVQKPVSSFWPREEDKRIRESSACYFSLANRERSNFSDAKKFQCSMWFEPKYVN